MKQVGKSVPRVDALDKVTGRAKYYEDLVPKDALYARVKHATVAHGFVTRVDTSAAAKLPVPSSKKYMRCPWVVS